MFFPGRSFRRNFLIPIDTVTFMNVILIGSSGTIGSAVHDALAERHDVVRVGRNHGDVRADISDPASIHDLFQEVDTFDAVVCVAGNVAFGPIDRLSDEDFQASIDSKLMGQVNLVRYGLDYLEDGATCSFTLVSGVLSTNPVPCCTAVSLANGGLEAFVRAAALDVPDGVRVNAVSPPWIKETLKEMGQDPSAGLPAEDVAPAFVESVEGNHNGEIIDAREYA